MGASAAVLGASGYTGGEVLRLLARHPAITVTAVAAGANAGRPLGDALPHLRHELDLELTTVAEAAASAQLCFSCLPHGALPDHLGEVAAEIVVDLGDDFRSHPGWTYGLPELARPGHAGTRIANPGCYPTAALLCLVPFARAGWITGPVVVDALSGVSGAGRAAEDRLLFANVDGGASAYGTVAHRHVGEIERGLAGFGGMEATVSFTPHLVPMPRGLLVTARAPLCSEPAGDPLDVLHDAYADEPFVHVTPEWPSTKAVAGTNHALVSARVDARAGYLVCSAAIDNLGKGAAGQAVQNANAALGLPETTGLEGIAVWP
ncbi:MAG TPA: N-acetyl-gamma-glutamyl-phosphate reductase [Actinomycetota bacterium]|nr:N-acetyl-gamma-glutamyl-phosphate reductase [Actinomycetota bacterium]